MLRDHKESNETQSIISAKTKRRENCLHSTKFSKKSYVEKKIQLFYNNVIYIHEQKYFIFKCKLNIFIIDIFFR